LKKVLLLILVLALAAGAAGGWGWYCITKPYQGFATEGVFVTVPHGASSRGVARLLENNGVVRSAIAFEIYARRHPRRSLEAGEYFFDHAVSGRDIFWRLAKGDVYQIPFTVREGETLYDIAHDLETGHFLSADDFVKAASDPMLVRDIDPHALTLEGFLFPATYQMPRHPIAVELTAAMVKKFKEQWVRILPPLAGDDKTRLPSGYQISAAFLPRTGSRFSVSTSSSPTVFTPGPRSRASTSNEKGGSSSASGGAPGGRLIPKSPLGEIWS